MNVAISGGSFVSKVLQCPFIEVVRNDIFHKEGIENRRGGRLQRRFQRRFYLRQKLLLLVKAVRLAQAFHPLLTPPALRHIAGIKAIFGIGIYGRSPRTSANNPLFWFFIGDENRVPGSSRQVVAKTLLLR